MSQDIMILMRKRDAYIYKLFFEESALSFFRLFMAFHTRDRIQDKILFIILCAEFLLYT